MRNADACQPTLGMGRFRGARGAWQALAVLGLGVAAVGGPRLVWAAGSQPTACVNLCPNLADPCVVTQTVTVAPGSVIDCGTRAVQVTGGDLLVHDAQFVLKAKSLEVSSSHTVTADCPQLSGNLGFRIDVTDFITVGMGSSLRARCDAGGGPIWLNAGGTVTIGGLGIDANGTASNATGGRVSLRTTGSLSTSAPIRATTMGGDAAGGYIELTAGSITVGDELDVGANGDAAGGHIALEATGDIGFTGTGLINAATSNGDGGDISMTAGGVLHSTRTLRARGIGSQSTGGSVNLEAERLYVDNDITAVGGIEGGGIVLRSRSGRLEIGTAASSAVTMDVSVAGNNPGHGGGIEVDSIGNDVYLSSYARLNAGNASGAGGPISIAGATVTAVSGSQVTSDGNVPGGTIAVQSRDQMTLSGTLHANNGHATFRYRQSAPTIGSGVTGTWTSTQDTTLPAPCGDGIRRDGVEACDGFDLGGKACTDVGYASGTLRCSGTCAYDVSDCH